MDGGTLFFLSGVKSIFLPGQADCCVCWWRGVHRLCVPSHLEQGGCVCSVHSWLYMSQHYPGGSGGALCITQELLAFPRLVCVVPR